MNERAEQTMRIHIFVNYCRRRRCCYLFFECVAKGLLLVSLVVGEQASESQEEDATFLSDCATGKISLEFSFRSQFISARLCRLDSHTDRETQGQTDARQTETQP